MAEYSLNQKRLERNCIAPSQSQASLQFTGIFSLTFGPWAKEITILQEEFASHELCQHSGLRKAYSCHAEAGKSPAMKQTYRNTHEGHKLPAFCCQGVHGWDKNGGCLRGSNWNSNNNERSRGGGLLQLRHLH